MNNTVLPSALIEEANNVTTNTTVHQMMMSDSSDSAAEGVDPGGNNPVLPLCANCKVFAIALYSLLSAVAFVGNALILTVIVRFRQLRTPTNMLIANLAVGDLMISIFCIPLSYWHVVTIFIIFDERIQNDFFEFENF